MCRFGTTASYGDRNASSLVAAMPRCALWIGAGGKPVTAKTLTKRFALACRKAGVRATFHSLRHTYAVFMLATLTRRLRQEGDGHVNAVKTLQVLLGHASLH